MATIVENINCSSDREYKVLLFYRFTPLENLVLLKEKLTQVLSKYDNRGRILISPEGINGTLASWGDSYKDLIEALVTVDLRFKYTDWKLTVGRGQELPFIDLFIKITKELIGTGLLGKNVFDHLEYSEGTYGGLAETSTGRHLTPQEFHEELKRQLESQKLESESKSINKEDILGGETILLDVRNDIEYQVGHFQGATNLETNYFSESWRRIDEILDNKPIQPKIMMYCTGGIRCEKASAYLIQKGISRDNIYQLKGGIHKYLEEYSTDGLFLGKNYVFDDRTLTAPTEYTASSVPPTSSAYSSTTSTTTDHNISSSHSSNNSSSSSSCIAATGVCQYCSQKYDVKGKLSSCTVCRLEVMICDECCHKQPTPPVEFHCKQHFHLKDIYFQNLEPFSLFQLLEQQKQLQLIYESLVGHHLRNKRRTLRNQINKINEYMRTHTGLSLHIPSIGNINISSTIIASVSYVCDINISGSTISTSVSDVCDINISGSTISTSVSDTSGSDVLSYDSTSSWTRDTVGPASEWTIDLSESDLMTLSVSADYIISSTPISMDDSVDYSIPLDRIDEEVSKLQSSSLGSKMTDICNQHIISGRGFIFLKRLPIEMWGQQKSAIAFLILSRFMGKLRSQNKLGHVLGHVVDLGLSSDDPTVRLYQTCERQTFHTDSADIVSLLCIRPALQGGVSSIVSAEAIYKEMKKCRPDLIQRLFVPMATDRRGEIPANQKPYYMIPVFTLHQGYLNVMYQRQYIDSAQRFPDAPRLTLLDIEALDYFDTLANSPQMQVSIQLAPGDIQILHNFNLLHDRSAFQNHVDLSHRRHLLRAWMCPPVGRPLPPVFAERFGSVTVGDRGGVQLEGVLPVAQWNI